MKIIGHSSDEGLLVEMSKREIAQIVGFGWEADMTRIRGYRCFDIGMKFDVGVIFRRLDDLTANRKRLSDAAQTLRAVADLVSAQIPATDFEEVTAKEATK